MAALAARLHEGHDGESVHALVYEIAQSFAGVKAGQLFQAIYVALLGKPRGPRAGAFIVALGVEFCARRFREASGA